MRIIKGILRGYINGWLIAATLICAAVIGIILAALGLLAYAPTDSIRQK